MGHYGGHGTAAAAMVYHVITIYEDVCCVVCVCCTEDYFHVTKSARGQYLQAVVCVRRKETFFFFQNDGEITNGLLTLFLEGCSSC